jgi:Undecaprenyl-phosphate galactose phosphotransferase WbaP
METGNSDYSIAEDSVGVFDWSPEITEDIQSFQGSSQPWMKRMFDVIFSTVALFCAVPIFVVLAILIKLDSPGPVFYASRRIGGGGRVFNCYKVRTMVSNADEILESHLFKHPKHHHEWLSTQKLKEDPRVTTLGRILRNSSLDELPQLWNVLRGEMSIVGPRPIVASEISKYGAIFKLYRQVLPGITGLWQVSGRSDTSYRERVMLDAEYITNWNMFMDIRILVKTIVVVFRRQGAY